MRLSPQDCCYIPALALLALYLVAGRNDMRADEKLAAANEHSRAAVVARSQEITR